MKRLAWSGRVALLGGLLLGSAACAQTMLDTSISTTIQNTLIQTQTTGTGSGFNKAQQVAPAQKAAAPLAPVVTPAPAVANPAQTVKPGTPVTSLTPEQQQALEQAQQSLKDKQYAQARQQFEALISQNFTNPDPHFGLGNALFALGDLRGASFEFTQFALLAPDRYEGPYNLGVIATREGRYTEALKFYSDAANLSGKAEAGVRVQILNALAVEQLRAKDFAALSGTYATLLALLPGDAKLLYRYAQALYLAGKTAEALPATYSALQAGGGDVQVIMLLADVYVAQGLPDRAMRELESGLGRLNRGTDKAQLLLQKANIAAAQGDLRTAVLSAQEARTADPTNALAYAREAEYRLGRNDQSGALSALEKAVSLEPKSADFRTDLAALYLVMNQNAKAMQEAEAASKLKPSSATLARGQYIQGVGLYRQGQFAKAKTLLNTSVLASPTADNTLWLGLSNYALKDYASAVAALGESVKLSPTVMARQNLASALLASGRYPDAEGLLRTLVTEDAKNAEGWYLLGLAQRSQQREHEARVSFKTAANLGNTRAKEALK